MLNKITMEEIRNKLIKDYNLAVDGFNTKDYDLFFRNFRPATERISKLLLYDFLHDDQLASQIINGEKCFVLNTPDKTFSLKDGNGGHNPTGKEFALTFHKAFVYRHPEYVVPLSSKEQQRLVVGLRGCGGELARCYDIASGFGNHTNSNVLSPSVQAFSCVTFLYSFFDFLKSNLLISPETAEFIDNFEKFKLTSDVADSQSAHKVEDLINRIEKQEAALLEAQAMQLEAEKRKLETEEMNTSLQDKVKALEETILSLNTQIASLQVEKVDPEEPVDTHKKNSNPLVLKLTETLKSSLCPMSVDEKSMDDDQLDLIDMGIGKSMLVTGCAGSGKSVIAMYKAEQLAKTGASVILIAYTKSLSAFMREGLDKADLNYSFYHHYMWKEKLNKPTADYIIVDEIQDFTELEIREFISAANVAYLFFGDSAQSIYSQYGKATISIEQISKLTGLTPLCLYNNYRLPRPIAKITQPYVGVNVNPYEDKVYQNKENKLPHIIKYQSLDEQIAAIKVLIDKNAEDLFSTIGILLPNNELVIEVCYKLQMMGVSVEFKYNDDETGKFVDSLDFSSTIPKILTYHSAKGLQFDTVVLPMYNGANDDESRKALYVAMTRAMHQLYILYSTPSLNPPLSEVPSKLYLKA